ncbi:MAG: sulfatase-like hydrolase/transferase [Oscillospiraceae bacterium]|nr:sulfatase-like hydrolase/transferase [Oscillospiraceae bacterium]
MKKHTKTNILIINPDQMRADAMGHLGNAAAHTPHLDRLAEEGVSFARAFCQNPVCVPSRCSFMTGLYPHVHGHRSMGFLQQPHEGNLFGDMKKAGYFTAATIRDDLMAGQYPKYHKAMVDQYLPVARPKKRALPFQAERGAPGSDSYYSFLGGTQPTASPEEEYTEIDDLMVEGAVRTIRRRAKSPKPFFLFVGLNRPHPPYQIERKYYDLIDKAKLPPRVPTIQDADGKPGMERGLRDALRVGDWSEERLDEIRAIYLAMCAKVDNQVGRLLRALKEAGVYDNTAVLFFSDHGDYTTDYGLVEKSQNCFPDCLVNVPFLIKPPKGVPLEPGVHHQLAELTDVCATVAGLAGITIERPHFSRSLLPAMADKNAPHRDFVCCEGGRLPGETQAMEYDPANHYPENHYAPRMELQGREDGTHCKAVMLRDGQYKYIRRMEEPDEFYELAKGERLNRIDDPACREQIDRMERRMLDWLIQTCDVVPMEQDSRHTLAYIKGGLSSLGLPAFLGGFVGLWLRITRQGPSQFLDKLERSVRKK